MTGRSMARVTVSPAARPHRSLYKEGIQLNKTALDASGGGDVKSKWREASDVAAPARLSERNDGRNHLPQATDES